MRRLRRHRRLLVFGALALWAVAGWATAPQKAPATTQASPGVARYQRGNETISVSLIGDRVLHIRAQRAGKPDNPTLVMNPTALHLPSADVRVTTKGDTTTLQSPFLVARWKKGSGVLRVVGIENRVGLLVNMQTLAKGHIMVSHKAGEALYGVGGYTINRAGHTIAAKGLDGLLRSGRLVAKSGGQGHAGGPFVWSTAGYGLLVDSGGNTVFDLRQGVIDVSHLTRQSIDAYILIGNPKNLFASLADLSGHAPMFPKWMMGFINSPWGFNEKALVQVVATYRQKHIPLDAFFLDVDWQARGEDAYGDFRWNGAKFPDGPSGALAKTLRKEGVHLGGIMKPRIHLGTVQGRYATAHGFWFPNTPPFTDYLTHKRVNEVDFQNAAARGWYGRNAIKYGFNTGIRAWWNDEADGYNNVQFLNMERSLYDAQRAHSPLRVVSINRNFWLGAQRYAYGVWSGDISTGFQSMADQRMRMLSAANVGEMQWSMDSGGLLGHPSDENYARWIEFAAFVPIFRVHGVLHERRQPWLFGPVAQAAAVHAIRLRYSLFPYIYSYEHAYTKTGIGIVRPLIFNWPHDAHVRNDFDSWMFGEWLLVSPVVKEGATHKQIYLPAGHWIDWTSGKRYAGGATVDYPVDSKSWMDIPLFVKAGAIIPTQKVLQYVGQKPIRSLNVDVFPTASLTRFDYYDDDGTTYGYATGDYFSQQLSVQRAGDTVTFAVGAVRGTYHPPLRSYLVKLHGLAAREVVVGGRKLAKVGGVADLQRVDARGWTVGHDRFGKVTYVRVTAGKPLSIVLTGSH